MSALSSIIAGIARLSRNAIIDGLILSQYTMKSFSNAGRIADSPAITSRMRAAHRRAGACRDTRPKIYQRGVLPQAIGAMGDPYARSA